MRLHVSVHGPIVLRFNRFLLYQLITPERPLCRLHGRQKPPVVLKSAIPAERRLGARIQLLRQCGPTDRVRTSAVARTVNQPPGE
jgi:hypothetical protein